MNTVSNPTVILFAVIAALCLVAAVFWMSRKRKTDAALTQAHEGFEDCKQDVQQAQERADSEHKVLLTRVSSEVKDKSAEELEKEFTQILDGLENGSITGNTFNIDLLYLTPELEARLAAGSVTFEALVNRFMEMRDDGFMDYIWALKITSIHSFLTNRLLKFEVHKQLDVLRAFVGEIPDVGLTLERSKNVQENPGRLLTAHLDNPGSERMRNMYRIHRPEINATSFGDDRVLMTFMEGFKETYRRLAFDHRWLKLLAADVKTKFVQITVRIPGATKTFMVPYGKVQAVIVEEQVVLFNACTPAALKALEQLGYEGVQQKLYRSAGFLNVELRKGNQVIILSDANAYFIDNSSFDDVQETTLVAALVANYQTAVKSTGSAKFTLGADEVQWFYNTDALP